VSHNTSIGVMEFGPVFNKDFLLAVYDLQQQILQVRTIGIIKQLITRYSRYNN